jgi:predicted amidohydrolase YtcJ
MEGLTTVVPFNGGAFTSFEEANRGSLEKGKQADFLILANDPTNVDAEEW